MNLIICTEINGVNGSLQSKHSGKFCQLQRCNKSCVHCIYAHVDTVFHGNGVTSFIYLFLIVKLKIEYSTIFNQKSSF